ncbi:MAG: glycosyltransferase family 1 protein [Candidatus Micrarchaeota archaeon]
MRTTEIDLITAEKWDGQSRVFGIGRYIREIFSRYPSYGVKINSINLGQIAPSKIKHFRTYFELPIRAALSVRAKVIHIPSQTLAFLLLLPIFRQKKTVLTVYDIAPFIRKGEISLIKGAIASLNAKGILKADGIVAISDYTKQELISQLGIDSSKIAIAYPAVDHSAYKKRKASPAFKKKYGMNPHLPIVLYVGSEEPRQNLLTLIKALSSLKKKGVHFQFVKVGSPAWPNGREQFITQLKSHGIFDDTKIIGYVDEADLPGIYCAARVFAYPCEYTGFGLPPLEAMACGVPVVTSNASSLPEVVGKAGIMVSPHDAAKFASSISSLLNSKALWKKYSRLGEMQSKKFSWGAGAKQTVALYKRLVLNLPK